MLHNVIRMVHTGANQHVVLLISWLLLRASGLGGFAGVAARGWTLALFRSVVGLWKFRNILFDGVSQAQGIRNEGVPNGKHCTFL